jgi:hypothetical protein
MHLCAHPEGCRRGMGGPGPRTVSARFTTVWCRSPGTKSVSPACYVLRAACCVLRAACCVLRAACCVLRAACCVLRAACCVLCAACCVLRAACCMRTSIARSARAARRCPCRGAAQNRFCTSSNPVLLVATPLLRETLRALQRPGWARTAAPPRTRSSCAAARRQLDPIRCESDMNQI